MTTESVLAPPARRSLERTLVVNPHTVVIACGADEVVVRHGARSRFSRIISDSGRTGLLGKVLAWFTTPNSIAKLIETGAVHEPDEPAVSELIAYLLGEGVLVDPRATVQAIYLSRILGLPGDLKSRSSAVIGAGRVGDAIVQELTDLGVGRIVLLDEGRVETNGHARGSRKRGADGTAGAKPGETPLVVMPGSRDDVDSLRAVFESVDLVVAAIDGFSSRFLHVANQAALDSGRPWLAVCVDGSEACIGPVFVPGETACYNEFEIQQEASLSVTRDDYFLYKESTNGAAAAGRVVLPTFARIAAGFAGIAVAHYLASGRSALVGRCHRIDFERMTVDYEDVLRMPRCPACSPGRAAYRHLFM